ncbi:PTS system mannose/fructose/sorbose family transporter subunit IID, partial [Enterococcus faecalis]|uniref:PTS system mannose/fructose/sorbose family transporter subunit IID n=1 Tax=Enterococcus faecalis TaxID=1351 RepID=UPI003D6BFC80
DELLEASFMRQLLFFNTQLRWGGGFITGLMASMEQERAKEVHEGREIMMQDDLMYNTKAGLLGAIAEIGDAIASVT